MSERARRLLLTAALALAACGAPAPGRPPAPPRALAAAPARSHAPAPRSEHGGGTARAASAEGQGDDPAGARADDDAAQPREQAFPTACEVDADCGYDPASERCGADPRLNRQPPVTDQGIVCYCDAAACALLRVLPVPCEGDHDCAVAHEPRPHPVRATRERPHERGRPCRDLTMSTTCERTNICTLRRHACPRR
ncbi:MULTISPECIES: hypothetical protein [Sorangium]|uniref:hypothetical protein n=1 Tax=Sorangium TaxID=39643 RepID=UPI00101A2C95|nr:MULTISPECIES: hypothetical protein [Sorangium]